MLQTEALPGPWPGSARARIASVLSLCLAAATAAAQTPGALSLDEALRLAAAAPAARALKLEVDRAEADVRGAGLWPNPELSFSREAAGDVEQVTALSQSLPWPGRLSLEKEAARRGVRAAEGRARQARVELGVRVRESFLDLLAAQERVLILERALERIEELAGFLAAREREGESSGYDRMRAERERADVRADLIAGRGRAAAARAELAGLLALPAQGLRAGGSLDTGRPLPPLAGVQEAAEARGDVSALAAAAEAADLAARAAARRAVPELSVQAGLKTNESAGVKDRGADLGVSLTLPLFDRGQGPRAAARAEGELLRVRREQLLRGAAAEAEAAWQEARARREAEAAYASAPDPDELVAIARAAYEEGETRILDLLDAYRASLAARLRTVDLHLEARRAEAELDGALGVDSLP